MYILYERQQCENCCFLLYEWYNYVRKQVSIMAEKKEKRYVSDNAQLMAEWNWEKNSELNFDPKTLTLGSNKKAWWKCSKGHEWQASIGHRSQGRGCPYCSNQKVLRGYNDLQTVNPTLA
jgi:hypothetical protein